jgi:hypothetical protein
LSKCKSGGKIASRLPAEHAVGNGAEGTIEIPVRLAIAVRDAARRAGATGLRPNISVGATALAGLRAISGAGRVTKNVRAPARILQDSL